MEHQKQSMFQKLPFCMSLLERLLNILKLVSRIRKFWIRSLKIFSYLNSSLISWCQTRKGHFLKAYSVANDAVPDAMATCNIRQDERDSLFTAQSVYLLTLMSFFKPSIMGTYLRPSDKSNLLVRH